MIQIIILLTMIVNPLLKPPMESTTEETQHHYVEWKQPHTKIHGDIPQSWRNGIEIGNSSATAAAVDDPTLIANTTTSSSRRSLTTYILWQASDHPEQDEHYRHDALQHQNLWIGLLASIILFLLSGLDGSRYCQTQESSQDIASGCRTIYITKIVPTFVIVTACSIFSIRELRKGEAGGQVRIHAVGLSAVFCLIMCVLSVIQIMLVPQTSHNVQQDLDQLYTTTTTDDAVSSTSNTTTSKEEFKEYFFQQPSIPYSLYSVNGLGEIGDNANLYHAIFGSFIFAFIIAHQYIYALALLYCCRSYLYWKKNRLKTTLFFRHRERVGSWILILVASSLVLISSSLLWADVLREQCIATKVEETTANSQESNNSNNRLTMLSIDPRICSSTKSAILMGAFGIILSLFSVLVHSSSHRFATRTIPLRMEGAASFALVLFYGFGNMFVTGSYQGGLAENVGNLYYATWCCFLFSLRVFIGCVEEAHHSEYEEGEAKHSNTTITANTTTSNRHLSSSSSQRSTSMKGVTPMKPNVVAYHHTTLMPDDNDKHVHLTTSDHDGSIESPQQMHNTSNESDLSYENPIVFVKKWLTLALLSAINHGAAYDAAQQMYFTTFGYNTGSLKVMAATYGSMSASQKWCLLCPFLVMCASLVVAALHLWERSYPIVTLPTVGLVCAVVASTLCASQILISQHAANSFAVNHMGGIVSANLYYFTWGSLFSAAYNLKFYYHRIHPNAESPLVFVLWFGLVKIGIVMVGASSHLWLAIQEDCRGLSSSSQYSNGSNTNDLQQQQYDDDYTSALETSSSFCWRTSFSLYAGLVLTVLSIVVSAMLVLKSKYVIWFQNIVGSSFAVLFTFGAGWITGMGGPAESVGDLYYSTWLAYAVSVAISSSWIKTILKDRFWMNGTSKTENDSTKSGIANPSLCEQDKTVVVVANDHGIPTPQNASASTHKGVLA